MYHADDHTPKRNKKKMTTIREDANEDGNFSGSDTAYFNGEEEEDFNNRDDYDSDEEEKSYEKRRQ